MLQLPLGLLSSLGQPDEPSNLSYVTNILHVLFKQEVRIFMLQVLDCSIFTKIIQTNYKRSNNTKVLPGTGLRKVIQVNLPYFQQLGMESLL